MQGKKKEIKEVAQMYFLMKLQLWLEFKYFHQCQTLEIIVNTKLLYIEFFFRFDPMQPRGWRGEAVVGVYTRRGMGRDANWCKAVLLYSNFSTGSRTPERNQRPL